MADKEQQPPISVIQESGAIRVSYDQVSIAFPRDGGMPVEAPALACRIFTALMCDLRGDLRAE